jgi:hypothetical protein
MGLNVPSLRGPVSNPRANSGFIGEMVKNMNSFDTLRSGARNGGFAVWEQQKFTPEYTQINPLPVAMCRWIDRIFVLDRLR